MTKLELAEKNITIRYSGVPTTVSQRAANRYPQDRPNILSRGTVPTEKWSEVFDS